MAFTNYETKEINCKIIYCGASQSGKTTNLRSLYRQTSGEGTPGILDTSPKPQLSYFDFLPLSVGQIHDFHLKFHLFTLPRYRHLHDLRTTILKGVDGIIFVVDGQMDRIIEHCQAIDTLTQDLLALGINRHNLPQVIQYNKCDQKEKWPLTSISKEINPHKSIPEVEASAISGQGVLTTIQEIGKQIMQKLAHQP